MAKPKAAPAHAEPAPRRQFPWILPLLAGTAVLYLWNLTASGWANSYYAAATQAASQSWKAWLFGSIDAGNIITVDKPPASLWLSGLFARTKARFIFVRGMGDTTPSGVGSICPRRLFRPFSALEKSSPAAAVALLWQLAVAQLGWMIAGEM